MSDRSDLQQALNRLVPLVGEYWRQPLKSYAAHIHGDFGTLRSDVRRDAFAKLTSLLGRRARGEGYGEWEISGLVEQLHRRPVLQTGPHCHLIIEPDAFFTHLFSIMGQRVHSSRWYISYAVSTVKFTERAKKGPGWLWLDDQNVNVFGLSRSRMEPFSICGRQFSQRFALKPADQQREHPMLDRLKEMLPDETFPSAAEAIKAANRRLWPFCFGNDVHFLQLDDGDVAELLIDHLRDQDCWLRRQFIGDPDMLDAFIQAVQSINEGPSSGWFKLTTHFFWLIRDGRLKPLRLADGLLRDGIGNFELPFDADVLADALAEKVIVPSMFLAFLTVAILPGLRALGGSRQVIYYPLMREAFLKALDGSEGPANRVLADHIRADEAPGVWGHRTIAPAYPDPWRVIAPMGPKATLALINHYAEKPLSETSGELPGFANDRLWQEKLRRQGWR